MRACRVSLVTFREETGPVRRPGPRSGPAFFLPGPVGPAKPLHGIARSGRSGRLQNAPFSVRSGLLSLFIGGLQIDLWSAPGDSEAYACMYISMVDHDPVFLTGALLKTQKISGAPRAARFGGSPACAGSQWPPAAATPSTKMLS